MLFLSAIVLSVLLQYTESDYSFDIFKLFFQRYNVVVFYLCSVSSVKMRRLLVFFIDIGGIDEEGWDRSNPVSSQDMDLQISWCSLFVFSELRWEVIVHFVHICGIDDHYCLNFIFISYFLRITSGYFFGNNKLPLEIQLSRRERWDPINMLKPATYMCPSQRKTWISNVICRSFFVFSQEERWLLVLLILVEVMIITIYTFL